MRASLWAALLGLWSACATRPSPSSTAPSTPHLGWWQHARLGLFVHWGLYSIKAGVHGDRADYGEWIRDAARIDRTEYARLREQWRPRPGWAEDLAALAAEMGAGYVVLTTKHHDGYGLFDSELSTFDAVRNDRGLDPVAEFATACRRRSLRTGFYHSIMDWQHDDYLPRRTWESTRPTAGAQFERYVGYLHGQVTELLTSYGKVDVMWFDGEWESNWTEARGRDLLALCRRLQPAAIVNDRVARNRAPAPGTPLDAIAVEPGLGDFVTPEQHVPAAALDGVPFETCLTTNRHWGHSAADTDWKSTRQLIAALVDTASKGGNLLLNVGPRADGSVPEPAAERLLALGRWLHRHAEAIRGTQKGPFQDLPWGRCTLGGDGERFTLYFHVLSLPADRQLAVPALGNAIRSARLCGGPHVPWSHDGERLLVTLPADIALDPDCPVVAVELDGPPIVYRAPTLHAVADEFVTQLAVEAVAGPGLQVRVTTDGREPDFELPPPDWPLVLRQSTTLKARAFHRDRAVATTLTRTFRRVDPWPARATAATTEGLACTVMAGRFEQLPDFDSLPVERAFAVAVPTLADDPRREHTARRFVGALQVPNDELWAFALRADDGARLWIDGRLVVDHDGLHGPTTRTGSAPLAAGAHDLRLEWFNQTGGAELELRWGRAGAALTPATANDFRRD